MDDTEREYIHYLLYKRHASSKVGFLGVSLVLLLNCDQIDHRWINYKVCKSAKNRRYYICIFPSGSFSWYFIVHVDRNDVLQAVKEGVFRSWYFAYLHLNRELARTSGHRRADLLHLTGGVTYLFEKEAHTKTTCTCRLPLFLLAENKQVRLFSFRATIQYSNGYIHVELKNWFTFSSTISKTKSTCTRFSLHFWQQETS